MADVVVHVEVRLWERRVGALVELADGALVFEYAPEFQTSRLEISPVHLPLRLSGPLRFDELRRWRAFEGLPGVFADSLPDAFGNRVIRAYFAARGDESAAMSPAQKLLYVGTRAIGALTYHPAMELPVRPAEMEALEVQQLARDARSILEGSPDVAVPEIYRVGSSAGGMRPKAVVHFDPVSGAIRSAFAPARPGDVPCILKFDGVGDGATTERLGRPMPFNRVEAAYQRMAVAAGIAVSDVRVLEVGGHAHLLVRRFDVADDGARLHQHTLGGLLHVDYNEPGASSYEEYLRAILRLGMPYASLEEGYRRAVFNVLGVNQDDHVKNLSFHMDTEGRWSLTPAYDLTFAKGQGWTARHQMRVQDLTAEIRETHLLAMAERLGVTRPGRIVEKVDAAVASWSSHASELGVPRDDVRRIQLELDARRREVFGRGPA